MRIAEHTMGTPERSPRAAINLFAWLGLKGIEAICHGESRSAIRTDISATELRGLRRHAEGQELTFAAIAPYTTDLNSPDPQVAAVHRALLLR